MAFSKKVKKEEEEKPIVIDDDDDEAADPMKWPTEISVERLMKKQLRDVPATVYYFRRT